MKDLRDFIELLRADGQLKVIDAPVDPVLEITEIADRVVKAGGPALLFTRPKGSAFPVLINQFGSDDRMCKALRVNSYEELAARAQALVSMEVPSGTWEKVKALGRLKDLAGAQPRVVKSGPCQEVVKTGADIDLGALPVLQCWPHDAGRFITLPLVFTKHPVTGRRNVGMYRLQVYDRDTTGMHWHIHKDGAEHFRVAGDRAAAGAAAGAATPGVTVAGPAAAGAPTAAGATSGAVVTGPARAAATGRMEVAVAIGTDPALTYAATAPLPGAIDEMTFAGFLREEAVDMVRCKTVDLEVPAHAEFVLEGYVDLAETRWEGPFGDHTGYYSLADDYPVFHLTALTHRKDAIYSTTIVGQAPMEDAYLGKATERLFLPLLRITQPDVVDMDLPKEGGFHNCAILSVDKRYPFQARKIMHSVWGTGQMQFTKCVVVVDKDVDVHDYAQVAWRVFNNVDWQRDVTVVEGPLDVLDHSSPFPLRGGKIGIDATTKWPSEGHSREWPADVEMSPEVKARVDELWPSLGLGGAGGRPVPGAAPPSGDQRP
jgi:4-hydroxy-3-polyprenylbenzoate decarboxylase